MLDVGERITLEGQEYEVKRVKDRSMLSCVLCDLKDCYKNRALDEVKAKHFALTCADLTPDSTYFKKVEHSPQVERK